MYKNTSHRFWWTALSKVYHSMGLTSLTYTALSLAITLSFLLIFPSCDKTRTLNEETTDTPIDTTTIPDGGQGVAPPQQDVISVGSGSEENLVIDGKSLSVGENKVIAIKGGRYHSITIRNISFDEKNPLRIINNGEVSIVETMHIKDVENVDIIGNGNVDVPYGFKFNNIAYRAIVIQGKMNGLTLGNISFRNVGDYVISRNNADNERYYDGTPNTRSERFKILNCEFQNTGQIIFGGSLNKDYNDDSGFIKDVEIAYNTFTSTDWGTLVSFNNVQDYDIHHNVVTDVNPHNNNHNGIFFMQGNGTFHDNKLINYQGNALRAWVYSRGNVPATVEIYNNICYNSRKYSAFELQQFGRNIFPGKSTHVNAKVYNNTVGKMNTSKDWEGQLLDLYHLSGELEYQDNLGFELYSSDHYKSVSDMINNMGDTKITRNTNNKYFDNQSDAVTDVSSFVSKHSGVGTQ